MGKNVEKREREGKKMEKKKKKKKKKSCSSIGIRTRVHPLPSLPILVLIHGEEMDNPLCNIWLRPKTLPSGGHQTRWAKAGRVTLPLSYAAFDIRLALF